MREKQNPSAAVLINKWFHSYETADSTSPSSQGQVIAMLAEGRFLVQLYSWLDGCDTYQKIIPLEAMNYWRFFSSNEDMKLAGDQVFERIRRKTEKELREAI